MACVRPGARRRSGAQVGVAVLMPYEPVRAERRALAWETRRIFRRRRMWFLAAPGQISELRLSNVVMKFRVRKFQIRNAKFAIRNCA